MREFPYNMHARMHGWSADCKQMTQKRLYKHVDVLYNFR